MNFENLNVILKKSDKGIEALKVRDPSLPQKSRFLLILIDGKKALAELAPLLTEGSDSLHRIEELLDLGFAEVVTQAQTAKEPSATVNSVMIDSSKNLQHAIRAATKMLSDMLGPNSDVLCMQLEKCKSIDEYNAKILSFRKVIGSMRSEKHGDEFVKAAIL